MIFVMFAVREIEDEGEAQKGIIRGNIAVESIKVEIRYKLNTVNTEMIRPILVIARRELCGLGRTKTKKILHFFLIILFTELKNILSIFGMKMMVMKEFSVKLMPFHISDMHNSL